MLTNKCLYRICHWIVRLCWILYKQMLQKSLFFHFILAICTWYIWHVQEAASHRTSVCFPKTILANAGLYIDEVALWASKKIADWPFHFSSSNCLALNVTKPPTSHTPMEDLMHWNKTSMCKWYLIHLEEILHSKAQRIHIINKIQFKNACANMMKVCIKKDSLWVKSASNVLRASAPKSRQHLVYMLQKKNWTFWTAMHLSPPPTVDHQEPC